MQLRCYQREAVDAILARFEAGDQRTLCTIPTGGGKTIVAGHVAKARLPHGRVMVLAHRDELIRQAADKIGRITGILPAIEKADEQSHETSLHGPPPIVVSSIQTQISGRGERRRMHKFAPCEFSFLFVDEGHHAPAESWKRVINHYAQNPNCKILGVTATADRADGEALGQVFQSVAYDYELPDIIRDGYLVPIRQKSVFIEGLDFSRVRTTAGDLNAGDLEAAMMFEEPLHGMAHATIELGCGLPDGSLTDIRDDADRVERLREMIGERRHRPTLIFCVSVAHAQRMAEIIARWIPGSAAHIDGAMTHERRKSVVRRFSDGRLQFLCGCMVPTEGFDVPCIEIVVHGRPTKSRALYSQMTGRGTRPAESIAAELGNIADAEDRRGAIAASDKPYLEVLDFVGNSGRHRLVTTADILGGTRYEPEAIELARKMSEAGSVDMTEALSGAKEEIERKRREAEEKKRLREEQQERDRQAEAARRAALVGTAGYSVNETDPFDRYGVRIDRHAVRTDVPARQLDVLYKFKVEPDYIAKASPQRIKELSRELIRRAKLHLCTWKQGKLLVRRGWTREQVARLSFDDANAAINEIAREEGWKGRGAA
jgi:superfamily II DNA or RNA helicase